MTAAVIGSHARSALFDQLNISTGSAVASSVGLPGTSATNATIPINNNGAVSPAHGPCQGWLR